MAKLGREEFSKKYSEKITDNDELLIEIMEDFTDSINNEEEIKSLKDELDKKERDYEDLKEKYKERFLSGDALPVKEERMEELEEKNVIDIREI